MRSRRGLGKLLRLPGCENTYTGFLEREPEFDLPVDLLEILLDGSLQIHFEHAEQQLIWDIILINTAEL